MKWENRRILFLYDNYEKQVFFCVDLIANVFSQIIFDICVFYFLFLCRSFRKPETETKGAYAWSSSKDTLNYSLSLLKG